MFKVVKRDGEVADFDLQKIGCAIEKAFDATQMQYNKDMVDLLNLRVTADFRKRSKTTRSMWRAFRTAWRMYWFRPDMQMWQKPTFFTANRGKRLET